MTINKTDEVRRSPRPIEERLDEIAKHFFDVIYELGIPALLNRPGSNLEPEANLFQPSPIKPVGRHWN